VDHHRLEVVTECERVWQVVCAQKQRFRDVEFHHFDQLASTEEQVEPIASNAVGFASVSWSPI